MAILRVAYGAGWLLFVLALPLLLFTTNVRLVANSYPLYNYGLEKYGAAQRLGLPREEVSRVAYELIAYWNSPAREVQIKFRWLGRDRDFFNPKEVAHLRDVKNLITLNQRFQEVALAYGLVFGAFSFWRRRRSFYSGVRWGGRLTLGLLLALGLGMALSFDRLFLWFHYLSFPNLLWMLDPATDRLIQMFPQGFFQELATIIAGATALEGALLWAVGGWAIKRSPQARLARPRPKG